MVYQSSYSPMVTDSPHSLATSGTVKTGPQLDTPVIGFNRAFMVRGFQGVPRGLGEFDVNSFLAGSSTPLIVVGAMLFWLAFWGPGITARRRALKEAKREYQEKVKGIKKTYPRLGVPVQG